MDNVILQNFEKNDIINDTIFNRNFPSSNLQMNFSPTPVDTRHTTFPILDNKKESNNSIKTYPFYNSEQIFFPGNRKPHFNGLANNIDLESSLRNQFFALQKADQAHYIPSSNSDMYNNPVNFINTNKNLNEELLFRKESFEPHNPNISNKIGNNRFLNSTRVQLKNL